MLGNMDFSKLNGNERLAVYGAAASIVGAILAQIGSIYGAGGLWLSFILALAMIAIGFLPILGALALFALYGGLWFVGIVIGIVGGLVMGWAGWQEFQAEGGKFQ